MQLLERDAPLICGEHLPTPFLSHNAHHLLQSLIACNNSSSKTRQPLRDRLTSNTSDDENLPAADVRHRTLGDLDQHGKDGLLQRKAQILRCDDVVGVALAKLAI